MITLTSNGRYILPSVVVVGGNNNLTTRRYNNHNSWLTTNYLRIMLVAVSVVTIFVLIIGIISTSNNNYHNPLLQQQQQLDRRNYHSNNIKNLPLTITTIKNNLVTTTTAADENNNNNIFLPGTIPNRTQILKRCLVPSSFRLSPNQGCTISEKYHLIYHMTPKSGSSTGRHVIKNDFNGVDHMHGCDGTHYSNTNWTQIVTLRNPTTRAFASYEEMFVRNINTYPINHIPREFRQFFTPYEKFQYPNYSAMFDHAQGINQLTRSYEQFMRDWDGTVFDMHLGSQVSYNLRRTSKNGRPNANHLTYVFDTHNMDEAFQSLAQQVGLGKKPRVIKGRAYPRRLNVSDVSAEAFQTMCRIYAVDYCCLNYELPMKCLNAPIGNRVRCRWVKEDKAQQLDMIETIIV
jgi:hypothetical protein